MKGLRSTDRPGEASDNLARLSLNKRSVQIVGGDDPTEAPTGKSGGGALGRGMRGTAKAAGKAGAGAAKGAGDSVVKGTALAATTAKTADGDEDTVDLATREGENVALAGAKRGTAATAKTAGRGVRSGGQLAGKAVKGGIVASQKRAAAAKAAKTTASTGTSITRFAAAQARAAAAAANALRTIVAAVAAVATSTPIITIVSAVLAVVLLIIALLAFFAPANAAACSFTTGGRIDPSKVPATTISGYGHEQLVNAAHIIQAAQDRGLSVRDQTIGVMTAMGESSLQILEHGDAAGPDSRGLFQQRDNWGTLEDRLDPYISAGKFFDAMIQKVPEAERQSLAPTLVAHKVQVNQDPFHYEIYWVPATAVVAALSGLDSSLLSGSGSCETIPGIPGEIGLDGWAKPGNGPINGGFGPREIIQTPAGPTQPFHYGIDLEAGGCGGPIWAARDGEVSRVFDGGGGGMIIEIDHGEGLVTWYVHSYTNEIMVSAGQKVKAGEQIALTGSSGYSTGCHLHFEVHLNGTPVDPLPILTAAGFTF